MSRERDSFLSKLSPDLRIVFDKAEKLMEEGLYLRARDMFVKIRPYMDDDSYLRQEIAECEKQIAKNVGPAAETKFAESRSYFESERDSALEDLARDLGFSAESVKGEERIPEISEILGKMKSSQELNSALDLSIFAGVSNNWQVALSATNKSIKSADCPEEIFVWRLSCLLHLENYAEAVALFSSRHWDSKMLIHVNFLAGLAYEGLGVRDQAKSRFEAVYAQNPHYRKVSQKLLIY